MSRVGIARAGLFVLTSGAMAIEMTDAARLPGARVLDGQFTAVQQAIGTSKARAAAATWLRAFVEEAKASGVVAEAISRNAVEGVGRAAGALPTTFVGSPDTVVEQVRRCRDVVGAGVLDLSLHPPGSSDLEPLMRSLELFGTKVLPRIRDI